MSVLSTGQFVPCCYSLRWISVKKKKRIDPGFTDPCVLRACRLSVSVRVQTRKTVSKLQWFFTNISVENDLIIYQCGSSSDSKAGSKWENSRVRRSNPVSLVRSRFPLSLRVFKKWSVIDGRRIGLEKYQSIKVFILLPGKKLCAFAIQKGRRTYVHTCTYVYMNIMFPVKELFSVFAHKGTA